MADGNVVVPFFYTQAVENPVETKKQGRPIFEDKEFVEYRFAGNRYLNLHFPAHEMHERINGEDITHAMRWPDQYAEFKRSGGANIVSGTPLEELTFLTKAECSELKALKIYTAEALAEIDGPTIKSLAGKGYKYKEQAQAYLAKSSQNAGLTQMMAEMDAMRAKIASLEGAEAEEKPLDKAALKDRIEEITGTRPQGNPSIETLTQMLSELESQAA